MADVFISYARADRAAALFAGKADPLDEVFLSHIWGPYPEAIAFRRSEKFKDFARRIGLVDYWKNYGWPDKCQPVEGGTDGFFCT